MVPGSVVLGISKIMLSYLPPRASVFGLRCVSLVEWVRHPLGEPIFSGCTCGGIHFRLPRNALALSVRWFASLYPTGPFRSA